LAGQSRHIFSFLNVTPAKGEDTLQGEQFRAALRPQQPVGPWLPVDFAVKISKM